MSFFRPRPEFHPDMSPDEAARVWMMLNECTDNGRAAITCHDDGTMSVKYTKSPNGIIIYLHNGTCIPVPYRYDGCTHNLLC